MKKSTKSLIQFLALGLVLAYPQDAMAGKNNFFRNLGKALGGDTDALKKIAGSDVTKVVEALGGDDAARAKLKRDFENAQGKLEILAAKLDKLFLADREEAAPAAAAASKPVDDTAEEKPAAIAGAGVAAPTTREADISEANYKTLLARIAAMETRFDAEVASRAAESDRRNAALRAVLLSDDRSTAAAGAGAAAPAGDDTGSPKKGASAVATDAELFAVQAAQFASFPHPTAVGTDDPAEPSAVTPATPHGAVTAAPEYLPAPRGAALPSLTEDKI